MCLATASDMEKPAKDPAKENVSSPSSSGLKREYSKILLGLSNLLLPVEKLENTPSMADGMEAVTEKSIRIMATDFIQTAGILLKLPQVAMASAQVLFQRYYYSASLVRRDYEITAMACVHLASKIEEAPRRMRDVINVFHHVKQARAGKRIQTLILDQNYVNLKGEVIKAERRVLKELGFCVHVEHPHKIIFMYLQLLESERNKTLVQKAWVLIKVTQMAFAKPEQRIVEIDRLTCSNPRRVATILVLDFTCNSEMVGLTNCVCVTLRTPEIIRNYMNDSFRSDLFVRYSPSVVATACIFLAARVMQIAFPPDWYEIFGVSRQEIEDISLTILRLYTMPKPDPVQLEATVTKLRDKLNESKKAARLKRGLALETQGSNPSSKNSSPSGKPSSQLTKGQQDGDLKDALVVNKELRKIKSEADIIHTKGRERTGSSGSRDKRDGGGGAGRDQLAPPPRRGSHYKESGDRYSGQYNSYGGRDHRGQRRRDYRDDVRNGRDRSPLSPPGRRGYNRDRHTSSSRSRDSGSATPPPHIASADGGVPASHSAARNDRRYRDHPRQYSLSPPPPASSAADTRKAIRRSRSRDRSKVYKRRHDSRSPFDDNRGRDRSDSPETPPPSFKVDEKFLKSRPFRRRSISPPPTHDASSRYYSGPARKQGPPPSRHDNRPSVRYGGSRR